MSTNKTLIKLGVISLLTLGLWLLPVGMVQAQAQVTDFTLRMEVERYDIVPERFDIGVPFTAYSFKWAKGNTFEYSWDGELYQQPERDIDGLQDANYDYSQLLFDPQSAEEIYIRNSSSAFVDLILIEAPQGAELVAPQNQVGIGSAGGQVNLASGANYSELPIVTRAQWGANESLSDWDPAYIKVDKIVVHHTAWDNSADYAATVRAIYHFHAVTRGWGDIGYNYLIAPDGTIFEGRRGGAEVVGAHAFQSNAGSVGISFMGNFSTSNPTEAAIASFEQLAAERALLHGFSLQLTGSGRTVFGHREMPNNNTACPGQRLFDSLPVIVGRAETRRRNLDNNSDIGNVRRQMEDEMQNYNDVRLELVFADLDITPAEIQATLPVHSGIKRILEIENNRIIIEVASPVSADTPDRVDMLFVLFTLDPNISVVNQLSDPVALYLTPERGSNTNFSTALSVRFSDLMQVGLGSIRIYDAADDSLHESISVNSGQVTVDKDTVTINPAIDFEPGKDYYVVICDTCFADTDADTFGGTVPNEWGFSVAKPLKAGEDFDGDGLPDLNVKTESGHWLIDYAANGYGSWDVKLPGYGGIEVIAVPADYDGDGKADLSVKTNGNYWLIDYATNGFGSWDDRLWGYGYESVMPFPADYDGDGKVDLSVRVNSGYWFIDYAANGFEGWDERLYGYGDNISMTAVPADYDGDGISDLSLKTNNGYWFIDYSANGFGDWDERLAGYGDLSLIPTPSDYDGDGMADLSLLSPTTWLIDFSDNGFGSWDDRRSNIVSIGASPLPADYDNDGRNDVALNLHTGEWLIDYTSNGLGSWDVVVAGYGATNIQWLPADYDGDGKMDLGMKDASGNWRVDYAANGYGIWDATFSGYGGNDYVGAPADYDGDGKADLSAKQHNQTWHIDFSVDGFHGWDASFAGYGGADMVPLPADYDGDGKADLSVKADNQTWFIDYSANGFGSWDNRARGYGDLTVVAVPADYDGDGKADLSVKVPGGTWLIDFASNGIGSWDTRVKGYGDNISAPPVPADYNGDTLADLSVKVPSGTWLIDYSHNGIGSWDVRAHHHGSNRAVLLPGDYDGDGKADLSVKTPEGLWHIDYAANGFDGWDTTVYLY